MTTNKALTDGRTMKACNFSKCNYYNNTRQWSLHEQVVWKTSLIIIYNIIIVKVSKFCTSSVQQKNINTGWPLFSPHQFPQLFQMFMSTPATVYR